MLAQWRVSDIYGTSMLLILTIMTNLAQSCQPISGIIYISKDAVFLNEFSQFFVCFL